MFNLTDIINSKRTQDVRKNQSFHVARVGQCLRSSQLSINPSIQVRPYSWETIDMFDLGSYIEDRILQHLVRSGVIFGYQIKLKDSLPEPFSGVTDFIIRVDQELHLIEVKSAHPNIMNYTKNLPKLHQKLQAKVCAYGCRKLGLDIKTYTVYYKSRGGTGSPLQFTFDWTDECEKEVEELLNNLKQRWDEYVDSGYEESKLSPYTREITITGEKRLSVWDQPSWECKEHYCNHYAYGDCTPPPKTLIAKCNKDLEIIWEEEINGRTIDFKNSIQELFRQKREELPESSDD